jgi:hypothetical protein
MSRHELDRAHLLSSLRVALDELIASPDAEQHYEGIWQLKETIESWIDRLDSEAHSIAAAKHAIDSGQNPDLGPIVTVK